MSKKILLAILAAFSYTSIFQAFSIVINNPQESYIVSFLPEQNDSFDVFFQARKSPDKFHKSFFRATLPKTGIIKVRIIKLLSVPEYDAWLLPNRDESNPVCAGSITLKIDLAKYNEENLCLEINAATADSPLPIQLSDNKTYDQRMKEYQEEREAALKQ